MFDGLAKRLKAHMKEQLTQKLGTTGEARVDGIGVFRYDDETGEATWEPDSTLLADLHYRAFPVKEETRT